ncbi:MAG: hypothetical protein KBS84_02830 [Treponema sp.]|nr:hypothetical protein [Candidatus Treponema scatequi]
MFSVNDLLGAVSFGSVVFSYTDEYSDEKLAEEYEKSDFEDAETVDDFADFDDDADLYGSDVEDNEEE